MDGIGSLDHLHPDPTKDAAGILGADCFLCGHAIVDERKCVTFGKADKLAGEDLLPQLKCHLGCILARPLHEVEVEYLRRLHDLVGARRPH